MVILLAPGITAAAQPVEGETLRALISALEDPDTRERLLEGLRGLEEAEAAEPAVDDAPAEVSLPRRIAELTQQAAEGAVVEVRNQIAMAGEVFDRLREADWGAFGLAVLDLAILIAVTVGIMLLLRRVIRPLFAWLDRWVLASSRTLLLLRSVPAILLAAALDLLAVVLAWVAGYGLALFVLDGTGSMEVRHSLFLNAFLLIEAAKVVLRLLFASRYQGLRVLPMAGEEAAYWNAWLSRMVGFIGYGLMLVVPIVNITVSTAAGRSAGLLVMLVAFSYAVAIILQNRLRVRERLEAVAAESSLSFTRVGASTLARIWHWVALLYFAALAAVSIVRPEDALPFMALATGQTLAAILAGFFVAALLTQVISRRIHLHEETRHNFPMLEERLNAYIPTALKVMRAVILLLVLAVILDAWAPFDLGAWIQSDAGAGLLATAFSVAIILGVAALFWLVVASWIEQRLSPEAGRGPPGPREKTLLTIFRNAIAIALVVIVTMIVLAEIGINIGPLIAGAGVLGLAIGFGAQTLVRDIITGVFIQLENAINTGDVVRVGDITGTVERLTIRSLGLRDLSGTFHLIPFSSVETVSNFTRDYGCHLGEYGVAYREDTDEVIVRLREAFAELQAHPEHGPKIIGDLEVHGVTALADSSVNVRVRIKTLPGEQWGIGREYNRLVKRHFDAAGIEIPFPHMTLYFGQDKTGDAPPAHLQVLQHKSSPGDAAQTPETDFGKDRRARANPKRLRDFDEGEDA
ncbi:MAG: mechanosensitive ion channel protein MscS [Thioalkalivibrio sp.]|nr:MAG: mechanosensitive ion channel protein MscS [Thioalkalivibrio sp.]